MQKPKRLYSQFYKTVRKLLRVSLPTIGTQLAAQLARAAIHTGLVARDAAGNVYWIKESKRK